MGARWLMLRSVFLPLLGRRDRICAVLIVLFGLGPIECLAATELVRDPNFQQLFGDRPVLWGVNTCNTRATVSVKMGADGKRWISLRNETIDACSDIATYGSKLSLPKGTVVRFSGWYRTENLVFGQNPLFYGTVDFNGHQGGDRFSIGSGALKPVKEWTRFEQIVSLKKSVQSFELVMLFFRCKGELLLRNIGRCSLWAISRTSNWRSAMCWKQR